MDTKNKGLGRLAIPDHRDFDYPMSEVLGDEPDEGDPLVEAGVEYKYYWQSGWVGNQGRTPRCVGYAWGHWLSGGPTTHFYEGRDADPEYMDPEGDPVVDPAWIYDRAQELDRWPGEDYAGTSVRAGAKALQEKGVVDSYHWAESAHDVVRAIKEWGPVVAGTVWYESMYEPDDEGIVRVDTSTRVVGGHAYLLNGVNVRRGFFRLKNSWGTGWSALGETGCHAHLPIEALDKLLDKWGEACLAVERTNPDLVED